MYCKKKNLTSINHRPNQQEKGNRPVFPLKWTSVNILKDELMCAQLCNIDVGEGTTSPQGFIAKDV